MLLISGKKTNRKTTFRFKKNYFRVLELDCLCKLRFKEIEGLKTFVSMMAVGCTMVVRLPPVCFSSKHLFLL